MFSSQSLFLHFPRFLLFLALPLLVIALAILNIVRGIKNFIFLVFSIFSYIFLAVISIILICIIIILIFIPISVQANTFEESLKYANSLRGTVDKALLDFDPHEEFKNQKGGYTENPTQASYYEGMTQSNTITMEKAAVEEIYKDEDSGDNNESSIPNVGKTLTKGFQTRPIFKITQDDEYIKKGNLVTKNAENIVSGKSNQEITCQDNEYNGDTKNSAENINGNKNNGEKKPICNTTYTKKACSEEIRTVRRICEKNPYVTLVDDPYPGCQRHISKGVIVDCLAGKVQIPHYSGDGYGEITVPRNRGSRVVFDDCKHGYYYVTIKNAATGQDVVTPRTRVNNGRYIELPFSKNQDQAFSFIAHRSDGCSCDRPGSLHVYFNYIRKVPKVEWKEELCRDV